MAPGSHFGHTWWKCESVLDRNILDVLFGEVQHNLQYPTLWTKRTSIEDTFTYASYWIKLIYFQQLM